MTVLLLSYYTHLVINSLQCTVNVSYMPSGCTEPHICEGYCSSGQSHEMVLYDGNWDMFGAQEVTDKSK